MRTEAAQNASMKNALSAIATMNITKDTKKAEALALCKTIAAIELEKCNQRIRR